METRKERPIIFPSTEMVRAVLEDRKTQHRWPIKSQPELDLSRGWWWRGKCYGIVASLYGNKFPVAKLIQDMRTACPYQVGVRLWVKEKWKLKTGWQHDHSCRIYYSDGTTKLIHWMDGHGVSQKYGLRVAPIKWRSPIYMPRWASRIKLETINIRVERVQDISEEDAKAEGVEPCYVGSQGRCPYRASFANLWHGIYAKKGYGWDKNPWVWVIELRKLK